MAGSAEWAYDGRRVWLLQARPITALVPSRPTDVEPPIVWSNVNTGEILPDVASTATRVRCGSSGSAWTYASAASAHCAAHSAIMPQASVATTLLVRNATSSATVAATRRAGARS